MAFIFAFLLIVLFSVGNRASNVASRNVSRAADNFEINRAISFYNGITGDIFLEIEGLCSLEKDNRDNQLEVICRVGSEKYEKYFLGLSDNVTYFAFQKEPTLASAFHHRIIVRPATIFPDFSLEANSDWIDK